MPMNRTLLDPSSDFAFKKIFGTEANKNLLLSFLNACLIEGTDKPKILDISFLKHEASSQIQDGRGIIIDVLCEDESGQKFLVEMQRLSQPKFAEIAFGYGARVYSGQQLQRGEDYDCLQPVTVISIAKFDLFSDKNQYKHDFSLKERSNPEHSLDYIRLVYYELPKFKKTFEQLQTIEDKWLYFFKNGSDEQKLMALSPIDAIFIQAEHALATGNLSPKEWWSYNSMEIGAMDEQTRLNDAVKDAVKKTEEITRKKEQLEMAQKLINRGQLSLSEIVEITGLTFEEIEALKNQK